MPTNRRMVRIIRCCCYLRRKRRSRRMKNDENQFTCHANEYNIRWGFFSLALAPCMCNNLKPVYWTMSAMLHRPCYGPFKMCSSSRWYMKRFMHCDIFFSSSSSFASHSIPFGKFFFLFFLFQIGDREEDEINISRRAQSAHIYYTHCYLECARYINTIYDVYGSIRINGFNILLFPLRTTLCFIFASYSLHCRSSFNVRSKTKKNLQTHISFAWISDIRFEFTVFHKYDF